MEKKLNLVEPPSHLDGAKVLKWAWSGTMPFGEVCSTDGAMPPIAIYGLAICQYEDTHSIYRFSCDKNWAVVQDADYESIENAITQLPQQYKNVLSVWQTKKSAHP